MSEDGEKRREWARRVADGRGPHGSHQARARLSQLVGRGREGKRRWAENEVGAQLG
jgi:hypothetical protein